MNFLQYIKEKIFAFDKEPQKIGLTQFKASTVPKVETSPSLKNKDIKLSDLMRRMN